VLCSERSHLVTGVNLPRATQRGLASLVETALAQRSTRLLANHGEYHPPDQGSPLTNRPIYYTTNTASSFTLYCNLTVHTNTIRRCSASATRATNDGCSVVIQQSTRQFSSHSAVNPPICQRSAYIYSANSENAQTSGVGVNIRFPAASSVHVTKLSTMTAPLVTQQRVTPYKILHA
jgi:hypothetical protein